MNEKTRNAPKPAPSQAAFEQWINVHLHWLSNKDPDAKAKLRNAFDSGWHAALAHHGLKR